MSRIGEIDIKLVRGDSLSKTLTFAAADGSPLDVSGWTFNGEVRVTPDSADPLATFAIDTNQAAIGQVVVSLDASDTENFSQPFVYYDIQFITDTGFTRTAPRGRIIVIKDVTRP